MIKHKFISTIADDTKPDIIKPSHWNEEHDFDMDGISISHADLDDLDYASAGHTGFVPDSRTITGAGLLNGQGGDLTANRTFTLNNSDIDHDALTNFVATEHIDHSQIDVISEDIDFTASDSEDITIAITNVPREILRGRLWIDSDPGAAFAQWATLTFYNKAAMKGEDAFFRMDCKLVYTELEVATTGTDANITPDDQTDFNPSDLAEFLDDNEKVRLQTIADTMVAEDNVGAHVIDTGLSRIIEFSGFKLFNYESGTNVYCRISFGSAQTVSLKLEMLALGGNGSKKKLINQLHVGI